MKYLIFTDLHGDATIALKMINEFIAHNCDKIIFLGDLLYHGPRNDLPLDYNPKKVIEIIKPYLDIMILIKGNCDAEVDSMVLDEKHFYNQYTLKRNTKKIIFTHGHHLSRYEPNNKLNEDDVVIYGHYHVFDLTLIDGVKYINIGSMSIPKDDKPGYAILENNTLSYYSINNQLIDSFIL